MARDICAQFKAVQNDLADLRGQAPRTTGIQSGRNVAAGIGELVLLSPPADGQLVTVPAGSAELVDKRIRLAVVGGVLSPGVSVAVLGNGGTLNGNATLAITTLRLVELVCVGAKGWFFST
jgi:hypothetical protein